MSPERPAERDPVPASFAAHVRAFHAGLPAEEQALLERVFALAQQAQATDEVHGFGLDAQKQNVGCRPTSASICSRRLPAAARSSGGSSPADKARPGAASPLDPQQAGDERAHGAAG